MSSNAFVVAHEDRRRPDGTPLFIRRRQHVADGKLQRWLRARLAVLIWLYFATVLTVWLLLYTSGDRWWPATMILFGPRWIVGLPLLVLVPAAVILQRRLLAPLVISVLVFVGPIAGLCLSWGRLFVRDAPAIRVLTCNVKGKCNRNEALDELIRTAEPDIVALQGLWEDVQICWPAGWHVYREEEFAIASRYPLIHKGEDHRWRQPGHSLHLRILHCTIQAPERDIDISSVHFLSPHRGLVAVIDRKTVLQPFESPELARTIKQRSQQSKDAAIWASRLSPSAILAGDFNMPPDSNIYCRDWAGYRNAFSDAGLGFGYTEQRTIRGLSWGIRIDHILTGSRWRCRSCWVGPDIGSDHLPLVADLVPAEAAEAADSPPVRRQGI